VTPLQCANPYNPWAVVAPMPIIVEVCRLPSGHGWWIPDERVILLDDRLDWIGRRCTLAHELEHVFASDSGCAEGMEWIGVRQESLANRRAAGKLITMEALGAATAWCEDFNELATELWVDTQTLSTRIALLTPAEQVLIGRYRTPEEEIA
jgi:hypothetical protein